MPAPRDADDAVGKAAEPAEADPFQFHVRFVPEPQGLRQFFVLPFPPDLFPGTAPEPYGEARKAAAAEHGAFAPGPGVKHQRVPRPEGRQGPVQGLPRPFGAARPPVISGGRDVKSPPGRFRRRGPERHVPPPRLKLLLKTVGHDTFFRRIEDEPGGVARVLPQSRQGESAVTGFLTDLFRAGRTAFRPPFQPDGPGLGPAPPLQIGGTGRDVEEFHPRRRRRIFPDQPVGTAGQSVKADPPESPVVEKRKIPRRRIGEDRLEGPGPRFAPGNGPGVGIESCEGAAPGRAP